MSETFFVQGFPDRAVSAFDTYLHVSNNDAEDYTLPIIIQLIRSFADFFVTAQFKESLQRADRYYASFHSNSQSKVVDDAAVRLLQ